MDEEEVLETYVGVKSSLSKSPQNDDSVFDDSRLCKYLSKRTLIRCTLFTTPVTMVLFSSTVDKQSKKFGYFGFETLRVHF